MKKHLILSGTWLGCALTASAQVSEDWNLHSQFTYVGQHKPAMRSPYAGPNSLLGAAETSYSITGTAALGLRLGDATELYVNPEVAQGRPVSGLLGLAGFTNGELAKTAGTNPKLYLARWFVRHTVALGGDAVEVASAANQLAGHTTTNRWVLTAGTLSVLDVFDANNVAHDPRMQFMNWALMTHAAYDYPADSRGYTHGVSVEYIRDGWALRGARFAIPKEPNQLKLDEHLLRRWGDQLELSRDYQVGDQTGTVRLLAYRMQADMVDYTQALAANPGAPLLDPALRTRHTKTGVGLALDHALSRDSGVFLRAFRADGKTETYAFTEADRSASIGGQLRGTAWARPDDTVGLGWACSGLSAAHRLFLARGGQTFFLGDGALNYRPEQDLELYYRAQLAPGLHLSADTQRIRHPGYNADRGSASFYALRLHWEN